MSTNQPDIQGIQRAVASALHEHWKLYLAEGIVLLVLGFIADRDPPLATLAVTILLGWLFLISGLVGLATSFWMRQARGLPLVAGSAALAIMVSVLLLAAAGAGRVIAHAGADRLLRHRRRCFDHVRARSQARIVPASGARMLVSGIVDLALSAMILAGLPSTAAWAIGLLVGINMMFGGSALIAMALHARKAAP